jgi:hypothetical protein
MPAKSSSPPPPGTRIPDGRRINHPPKC